MHQEVESIKPAGEVAVGVEPRAELYDLHIKVPNEVRGKLRDAAELAYRLEQIPKPDLVDLMSLFIGWGLTVLKQQWLDRMGYR